MFDKSRIITGDGEAKTKKGRRPLAFDVLSSLIGSIVFFSLGWFGQRFRQRQRARKPAAQVWRLSPGSEVTVVIAAAAPIPDEGVTAVYPTEMSAANEVSAYLTESLGCRVTRVCTSKEFSPREYEHNLVVIGGPIHNSVARTVLGRIRPPLHFEEHDLVDDSTDRRYKPKIVDGKIVGDTSLLVLAPNPFNAQARVIVIAGCRTYGCLAGARTLIGRHAKTTAQLVKKSAGACLVVHCEVLYSEEGGFTHLVSAGHSAVHFLP